MDEETEGDESSSIHTKPVSEPSEKKSESPEPKATTTTSDNKRKLEDDDSAISAKKVAKIEKVEKASESCSKTDTTENSIQPKVETKRETPKVIIDVQKPTPSNLTPSPKSVKKESNQKSKEQSSNNKKPIAKKPENSRRSTSKRVETGSAKSVSPSDRLSRSRTRHVISSGGTRTAPSRGQKGGKNNKNVPEKRSLRNKKRK